MSSIDPSLKSALDHLREIRSSLLSLHKALLDSEQEAYERVNGPIRTKGELFQLVVGDEWFNWLRPISQFIVRIDESLASKESITLNEANELIEQANTLLNPLEVGTEPEERYYQVIQRDPDVAYMHARMMNLLKRNN
ncbi:hypothetical protein [Leptodesmis sp.]|uniref:hypothetical protein n=1 Tax=Leptodesmis sp. TaxID=3100501 RepID=UPI0040534873